MSEIRFKGESEKQKEIVDKITSDLDLHYIRIE